MTGATSQPASTPNRGDRNYVSEIYEKFSKEELIILAHTHALKIDVHRGKRAIAETIASNIEYAVIFPPTQTKLQQKYTGVKEHLRKNSVSYWLFLASVVIALLITWYQMHSSDQQFRILANTTEKTHDALMLMVEAKKLTEDNSEEIVHSQLNMSVEEFQLSLKDNIEIKEQKDINFSDAITSAYYYLIIGDYQNSIDLAKVASEIEEHSPIPYEILAIAYGEMGKYNESVQYIDEGLARNPNNPDLQFTKGIIYKDWGRQDNSKLALSITIFEDLIHKYPEFADAWNGLGTAHYISKDYDNAIPAFKKAIDLDPKFPQPYNNLGAIYSNTGKFKLALEYYENASQLQPLYQKAIYNTARLSRLMDDYPSAVGNFTLSIELYNRGYPQDEYLEKSWYYLGLTYVDQYDFQNALGAFNQALIANPNYEEAQQAKRIVQQYYEKYSEHLRTAKIVLEHDPTNISANYNAGTAALHLGHYEDARAYFNKTLNTDLDEPGRIGTAYVHYWNDDYRTAASICKSVVETYNTSDAWNCYGRARYAEGAVRIRRAYTESTDPFIYEKLQEENPLVTNQKELIDAGTSLMNSIMINETNADAWINFAQLSRSIGYAEGWNRALTELRKYDNNIANYGMSLEMYNTHQNNEFVAIHDT